MASQHKPTALDLFADLNWALDRALVPHTPHRAALEVPSSPAEWMIRDFGTLLQAFPCEARPPVLHVLMVRMVRRGYPQKTMASVLNASGVSPEEMQAYRLHRSTQNARGRSAPSRL